MVFEKVPKSSSGSHPQTKSNSALPTRPWTDPLQEQATADNQITPLPKYQSNLLLRLLETSSASNENQPQEDVQQAIEKPNVQMKCTQSEAEETLQTYAIKSTATESDTRVCQNQLKQERQKSVTSIANAATQKPQSPQSSSGLSTPTHSNTSTTVAQGFNDNIIEIDSEIKDNPEEIWIKIFLSRHRDWSRQQAIQWIQQQKAHNGQFKDGERLLRYHGPFPYPQTQNKFYVIVEEVIYQQQSESTNSEPQRPTGEAGQPSELSGELIPSVPNRLSFLLPAQQQTIAIKDAADWVNYTVEPSENGFGVTLSLAQARNRLSLPTQVWRNTLYPLVRVQRYRNGSRNFYGIGSEIPLFVGDIVSIALFDPNRSNGSDTSGQQSQGTSAAQTTLPSATPTTQTQQRLPSPASPRPILASNNITIEETNVIIALEATEDEKRTIIDRLVQLGIDRHQAAEIVNSTLNGDISKLWMVSRQLFRGEDGREYVRVAVDFRLLLRTPEQQLQPGSDDYYVAQFKELLKINALKRLEENRERLHIEANKYKNTNPQNPQWQRLRQAIEKDQELAKYQKQYEEQKTNAETSINDLNLSAGSLQSASPDEVDAQYTQPLKDLEQQIELLTTKIDEIKKVRNTLRSFYPTLNVLKISDISSSTSNQALGGQISAGFAEIFNQIEDVKNRIQKGDMPLHKLTPVVEETKKQLNLTEKHPGLDPQSRAIFNWLERQDRQDKLIEWGGIFGYVSLSVAAFFATGGVSLLLQLGAAGTGLGTSAYQLERSDDLYAASRTSQAGGKPLVGDPEAARFEYIMGWVNLVLAGLDVGLVAKTGTTLLKGARTAERIAGMRGAQVLSRLQPEEIAKFDQVIQLQNAGQVKEAQAILDELKSQLKARFNDEGEEIFSQANSVFQRVGLPAAKVSELNGFKNVLPNDLRDKVSIQVDPNLTGNAVRVYYELDEGLVSNIYMLVGSKTGVRDIQLHVPTVRLMRRYSGISGRVQVLSERIRSLIDEKGTPPVGSLAWEAKLEIEKLPRIINDRLKQLAGNTLDTQARIDGLNEIEDLTEQLAKYERTLDEMDFNPGEGFVAAGRRAARRGEPERFGYPPLTQEQANLYYYIREETNNPNRPRFLLERIEGVRGKRFQLVLRDGQYRIEEEISNRKQPSSTDRQQQTANRYSQPATDLSGLEDAIKAGNFSATIEAYIRSWEKAIISINEVLNQQLGNGNDLNLTQLIEGLSQTQYERAASLFRNRLRQQIAEKILLEPNGSERMKLLETCGDIISQPPHSNKDKGELFTVFRNKDFEIRQTGLIENVPDAPRTQIAGTSRNADDVIRVISQDLDEGAPKPGTYLVEDKNGKEPFDPAQAQRYSSYLDDGKGKIQVGNMLYDGFVYFFYSIKPARKAMRETIKNLNENIYVGYYDENGEIRWLSRLLN